jgi:hypothetical protein
MRRYFAYGARLAPRALLLAIGFGGASLVACSSSSSGGGDNAGNDSGSEADGTTSSSSGGGTSSGASSGGASSGGASSGGASSGGASSGGGSSGGGSSGGSEGGTPSGIKLPGNVDSNIHIAVNRTTSKFYTSWFFNPLDGGATSSGISVIDAKTGNIGATINLNPRGSMAVDETNNLLYVPIVASSTPQIAVVDGTTNAQTTTIYQAQGQSLDAGSGVVLSNLGITSLAVDPANNHLFALLGDGGGNAFVFEYDTSAKTLLASVEITGSEPGAGLVMDSAAHTLWVVTGHRPSLGAAAIISTIDTSSFTVTSNSASQPANATDVTLATGHQALVLMPQVGIVDAGGILPAPGTTQLSSTTGALSSPFTPPTGLAALFGRVLGGQAYVYANNDAGAYYLLDYNAGDAGAWSLHGQSSAITPQPQPGQYDQGDVLNAYSFEVVTDSTKAYIIATMLYDGYDFGSIISSPTPYVQYWSIPLP